MEMASVILFIRLVEYKNGREKVHHLLSCLAWCMQRDARHQRGGPWGRLVRAYSTCEEGETMKSELRESLVTSKKVMGRKKKSLPVHRLDD